MLENGKVSSRPQKALLLYDGDCGFCEMWAGRWREQAGDRFDIAKATDKQSVYPEIDDSVYGRSVVLIETDGSWYTGAAAVCKALGDTFHGRLMLFLYMHFLPFRFVSERAYVFVAHNRKVFSIFSRVLWGKDTSAPTYSVAGWLFPRMVGLVGLMAILPLWLQAEGLFGIGGIQSFKQYLNQLDIYYSGQGVEAWEIKPTLFWWIGGNAGMHTIFSIATIACIALVLGLAPMIAFAVLWVTYLSILNAGGPFLSFQWDILLVQVSFLGILSTRWQWLSGWSARLEPSRIGMWVIRLSFIAFMLESGFVKLSSYGLDGGNSWRDLSAMSYHYWTQPLPHALSWSFHHLPQWFHQASLLLMLFIEIVLPFFLLGPRRLRAFAVIAQIVLQLMIMMSGNYGYFNLLTIVLCVPFIDDGMFPKRWRRKGGKQVFAGSIHPKIIRSTVAAVLILIMAIQLVQSLEGNRSSQRFSRAVISLPVLPELMSWVSQRLYIMNGYGLFRVMTTTRPEIVIEASMDGESWKAYEFKYKPQALDELPAMVNPYMPRLDWQMWFAALSWEGHGDVNGLPAWFRGFLRMLSTDEDVVLRLLANSPTEGKAPKAFRLSLYEYEFTDHEEREETGDYWKRKLISRHVLSMGRP